MCEKVIYCLTSAVKSESFAKIFSFLYRTHYLVKSWYSPAIHLSSLILLESFLSEYCKRNVSLNSFQSGVSAYAGIIFCVLHESQAAQPKCQLWAVYYCYNCSKWNDCFQGSSKEAISSQPSLAVERMNPTAIIFGVFFFFFFNRK